MAALIDGEGSIRNYKRQDRNVSVSNTEPAILDAYVEALTELGISYKRYPPRVQPGRKDIAAVYIFGRENFIRLRSAVRLRSDIKREKLDAVIASYGLPRAPNPVRTHCRNGHELTADNVYCPPNRGNLRVCRTCAKRRRQQYEQRNAR